MIRRINFTGRRKLPHKIFAIAIQPGLPRSFDADFDISPYRFPPESRLYFEAYSSGSQVVMRFPWGSAAHPQRPDLRVLEDVDGQNVLFNFKVVDETESVGRILGIARSITLRGGAEGSGRDSLLPVNPVALEQQVWRVSFEHDLPWLEVNSAIPDIMNRAKKDPSFLALVYPAVIREILSEAVVIRGATDPTDLENWEGKWISWGVRFHPDRTAPPDSDDEDHKGGRVWIEQVVSGFCAYYRTTELFVVEVAGDQGR